METTIQSEILTNSDHLFTVRRGTLADLDLLVNHRISMFRDMKTGNEALLARITDENRVYLLSALADETYIAWVVEWDGHPAGSGAVMLQRFAPSVKNPTGWVGYILSIYTEKAFRRRGVATLVMNTILAYLCERGIPIASLHASDEGKALYEKMGFKVTNEMRLTLL